MAAARPLAVRLLRMQCRRAPLAAYVSSETLQKRYPVGGKSYSYSSIDLAPDAFEPALEVCRRLEGEPECPEPFRLVFVGRLWRRVKGLDCLLEAGRLLSAEGRKIFIDVVGAGPLFDDYRATTTSLALDEVVRFHGELASPMAVREVLRKSHLFVLPSIREGLPRALIEAMAVGLPAIATPVGGTPELLSDANLFPTGNSGALADLIREFMDCKARRVKEARRNSEVAKAYSRDILREERRRFYDELAELESPRSAKPISTKPSIR